MGTRFESVLRWLTDQPAICQRSDGAGVHISYIITNGNDASAYRAFSFQVSVRFLMSACSNIALFALFSSRKCDQVDRKICVVWYIHRNRATTVPCTVLSTQSVESSQLTLTDTVTRSVSQFRSADPPYFVYDYVELTIYKITNYKVN